MFGCECEESEGWGKIGCPKDSNGDFGKWHKIELRIAINDLRCSIFSRFGTTIFGVRRFFVGLGFLGVVFGKICMGFGGIAGAAPLQGLGHKSNQCPRACARGNVLSPSSEGCRPFGDTLGLTRSLWAD